MGLSHSLSYTCLCQQSMKQFLAVQNSFLKEIESKIKRLFEPFQSHVFFILAVYWASDTRARPFWIISKKHTSHLFSKCVFAWLMQRKQCHQPKFITYDFLGIARLRAPIWIWHYDA